MGILSYGYKGLKALMRGGKQKTTGTEVISAVNPNVPKTKIDKAKSLLAIAKQKTKASQAKLDNTIFRNLMKITFKLWNEIPWSFKCI